MGFESINQPGQSSEVERNPKMSISFFLDGEGWQMGFESIYPYPFEIEIHQFPVQAKNQIMVLERGGVDCKMYLMTSLEMILFYSIHVKSNFDFWVGGVHQPEPKCHIDLRFQLTSARTEMSH